MGWHVNDLTAAAGAPLAVNSATPKGYVFEAQRTQHVIYLGPSIYPGRAPYAAAYTSFGGTAKDGTITT